MPDAVADTHALIWYLQDDPRLSQAAGTYFDSCQTDGGHIHIPSICAVELVYLAEKGRIPPDVLQRFFHDLATAQTVLRLTGLTLSIVLALSRIPRGAIPDLPDRIIAAAALDLALPLLTRDRAIQASGVATIW